MKYKIKYNPKYKIQKVWSVLGDTDGFIVCWGLISRSDKLKGCSVIQSTDRDAPTRRRMTLSSGVWVRCLFLYHIIVFMSSWWMQCNLTLILSKSSWKEYAIVSQSKAACFFILPLDSTTQVKGYHQWWVTFYNNSMWAKEGLLYVSQKKQMYPKL